MNKHQSSVTYQKINPNIYELLSQKIRISSTGWPTEGANTCNRTNSFLHFVWLIACQMSINFFFLPTFPRPIFVQPFVLWKSCVVQQRQ
jgi:hypothetical protein